MSKYSIKHRTTYDYAFPVSISHHLAHLEPLSNNDQTCDTFKVSVSPTSEGIETRDDYYGNIVQMFSIQEMHKKFIIESESVVKTHAKVYDLNLITMSCADARSFLTTSHPREHAGDREFIYSTSLTPDFPELQEFSKSIFKDEKPFGLAIKEMLDVFKDEFKFDPKATDVYTPISQILTTRKGVCQDFAHTMIAALRSYGFAAKYVSGYILSHPPKGMARLEGADASHAWVSVFVPHLGWVDVDPTNRLVCGNEHIRVAYGRDYSDVSMIKGAVTGGGKHTITVQVTVAPFESRHKTRLLHGKS